MKKLDAQALEKLRTRLEGLPPRDTLRPYEVIAQLAETLSSAQGRGYDIDDLMAVLNESGITLARNTVRNYLSRALAEHRKGKQPATRSVSPPQQRSLAIEPATAHFDTGANAMRIHDDSESVERPLASAVPPSTKANTSPSTEAPQSVLTRARSRARASASELPTPGSFRLRPDTKDL